MEKSILSTTYDEDGFASHDYNLPVCYQNKSSLSEMIGSEGRKIYVAHEMFGLPKNADTITSDTAYKKLVKDVIESKEFAQKVINKLMDKMGTTTFLTSVKSKVQGTPNALLNAKITEYLAGSCTLEDVYSLIDPTSNQCVVEWDLVATSMFGYRENHVDCDHSESEYKEFCKLLNTEPANTNKYHPDCSFWELKLRSSAGTLRETLAGLGYNYNYLVMDSWWSAQYNITTKRMYKYNVNDITDNDYVETLVGQKFFLMTERNQKGSDQQAHAGTLADYQKLGKLSRELYDSAGKVAAVTHDTHDGTRYCGVLTSKGYTQSNFATAYNGMYENAMMKYGGISVYIATIADPGIPVYYYVYDPDHPDADPEVITSSYTPKDGTTTFTPSTDTGLPADCTVVAEVSYKNTAP